MIIDISNKEFKSIFDDKKLYLPIRWDGNDFYKTLNQHFELYLEKLNQLNIETTSFKKLILNVQQVCSLLLKSVENYLDGFPPNAFVYTNDLMTILMDTPLKIYRKNIIEQFEEVNNKQNDPLKLYRVVGVKDNICYDRSRVFHTPYTLRSKVSTSRYSIAGYPSLYLGTSLELCCEELHLNTNDEFALASRFNIQRSIQATDTIINIIELAIKPQDFINEDFKHNFGKRNIYDKKLLNDSSVKHAYLLWYPVIAACSFIRVNKKDPFAVEYIVPQMIMQWIRKEVKDSSEYGDHLIGIRYFSCASIKASEMGFNYVFPTSGKQSHLSPYCPVLMQAFKLTAPQYIHEYETMKDCENYLSADSNLKHINSLD